MTKRCHRVVQLTDLHLAADPAHRVHGYLTDDTARRVLAAALAGAPDLLVLSGDLADAAEPSAYERLLGWLVDLPCPVLLLPGNHDAAEGAGIAPLAAAAARYGRGLCEAHALGRWQILGLDSTVAGLSGGRFGAPRLDALRRTLAALPPRAPLLAFVHHHPVAVGSPWIDAMMLEDGNALVAALRSRAAPALVASGHVHQALGGFERGLPWTTAPSTCSQARPFAERFLDDDRGPGMRWFELRSDGAWTTAVERLA